MIWTRDLPNAMQNYYPLESKVLRFSLHASYFISIRSQECLKLLPRFSFSSAHVPPLHPRSEWYETFPFLCEKRTWRPITTKALCPNSILSRSLFLYTSCFTRYHLSSVIYFPQANSSTLLLTDGWNSERERDSVEADAHSYDPQIIVTSASGRGWGKGSLLHCTESCCYTWWLQNVVDNTWRIAELEWSAKVDGKIYVPEMRTGILKPTCVLGED